MSNLPKISIIIPYIDELEYLTESLASALGQEGIDQEIILVCNAASITNHPTFTIPPGVKHLHEPSPGSAFARNAGLAAAIGTWVQFLDVDDLLSPQKIFHQLTEHETDVVVSPHTFLFASGRKENSKWLPEDFWCGLLNSGLGSTSSMLWKRTAVVEAGGWNTSYQSHQEYELLFRLARDGKNIVTNDHCETMVRQRKSGSITQLSKPVRLQEGIRLREHIWEYLLSQGMATPSRYDAFRQYIYRQLRGLYRQDKKAAMDLYEKYFSKDKFTPEEIHVPGYKLLYKVFGFSALEKFLTFASRIRKKVGSGQ